MSNKRELGQYYTIENPFNHPLFHEWMAFVDKDNQILEPFAGANNILKLVEESGYDLNWSCYDISPSDNPVYECDITKQDTIENFPSGYETCITNPPYLGKSSASRRHIDYPWEEDDLYKVCMNLILDNCNYAALIIPESFITSDIHHKTENTKRLWGVVSLTNKMFNDTNCPVCLAMFTPEGTDNVQVYSNSSFLGTLAELQNVDITGYTTSNQWIFNDKNGNIGVKTVDSQTEPDCKFFHGEEIDPSLIKISSRAFSRISGLPSEIDRDEFIHECNRILNEYREQTKDVMLTSFKGLRKDGKYRRRLDFKTVKCIMNKALINLENNSK